MNEIAEIPTVNDGAVWEQQEAESSVHFSWFHTFLMMGEGRSLMGAYNAFRAQGPTKSYKVLQKKPSPAWKAAAENWYWRARAQAWDIQQRKELESRKARERLEKEKELDERLFQIRIEAIEKVEQMLDFPLYQVTTETPDGKQVTVEPVHWNMNSMVRLLESVIKMKQQQDETEITIKGKNLESGAVAFRTKSASEYSDDELLAIATGGYDLERLKEIAEKRKQPRPWPEDKQETG